MPNMTKVELELFSDADMYLFSEKGMRDGVSHISERYSKANKKYLKSCGSKQESKHIIYLDPNNLYGYAMSKFLSTGKFKWIDPKEFDMTKYTCNSSKGCVLKLDLEYPKASRELHNEYQLVPDKIEIKKEVCKYQLMICDLCNVSIGNVRKLVSNLFDRERCVLHYENLQLDLRLGLRLEKNSSHIRIQSVTMTIKICRIQYQKRVEAGKNGIHGIHRIHVKLVSNEKDYLKWT